jgi:hypothetical protein
MLVSVLVALMLQALVWWFILHYFRTRHPWYGFYDISDIGLYQDYARQFARGLHPYSDVRVEYPPLAIPLMSLAQWLGAWADYADAFAGEMIALCVAAAVVSTAAAVRLSQGFAGPIVAAFAFAFVTLFTGPIVANRFDVAVALDIALFLYCVSRRWWTLSAAVLGVGFALKLTPGMLLPLIFLLAPKAKRIAWAGLSFFVAAALPFVPYLLRSPRSLLYIFKYHAGRPLQIESLYATPYLLGHAIAGWGAAVGNSHGSQSVNGAGTGTLASLSLWIMLACVAAFYLLLWRRRKELRASPADVPAAALALVLLFVCTSKVLSPQFLIWSLPLVALVIATGTSRIRMAGGLLACAVLLTQMIFPSRYWDLVAMHTAPVVMVAIRNLLLLSTGVLLAVALLRRPAKDSASIAIPGQLGA